MAITIPETITVHLGSPGSNARNVTVPFTDYIKNVASNEIYPTWPEEAIRANILAQISYALNRIYTEWYPSMGYDYDITNDIRYDQTYKPNSDVFENISEMVDEIFNNYIVNNNSIIPYFAAYCDGRNTRCDGLEQWGTLELANNGLTAEEILESYYGDAISIIENAPVENMPKSYPGIPLRLGSGGEDVRSLQRQLNRISQNYPAIPKSDTDGIFDIGTEEAVREFQKIFNLQQDGIVGKATWYKVRRIYNAVMQLAELFGEPITPEEAERIFAEELPIGSSGEQVQYVQYYLGLVGYFDDNVPLIDVTGYYDENTKNAVTAFQNTQGLEPTGILDRDTWNALVKAYNQILSTSSDAIKEQGYELYPGRVLTQGMQGEDVRALQTLLQRAAAKDNTIPSVEVTGVFDKATEQAVRNLQQRAGYKNSGAVGALTWDYIVQLAQ